MHTFAFFTLIGEAFATTTNCCIQTKKENATIRLPFPFFLFYSFHFLFFAFLYFIDYLKQYKTCKLLKKRFQSCAEINEVDVVFISLNHEFIFLHFYNLLLTKYSNEKIILGKCI